MTPLSLLRAYVSSPTATSTVHVSLVAALVMIVLL